MCVCVFRGLLREKRYKKTEVRGEWDFVDVRRKFEKNWSEKNLNIVCEESERLQHIYLSIMESDLIGLVEMFSSIDVEVIHSVLESYGT